MKKIYCVIILTVYYLVLVEGMVLTDGTEYLDYLLQKNYRYEHDLQNYQTSLKTGLIPNGLKIKKSPAITPVSENSNAKWNEVLYNAEKSLVELLLYELPKLYQKFKLNLILELER